MRMLLGNLALAFVFMAVTGFWSAAGLLLGLAVGFLVVSVLPVRRPPGAISYARRVMRVLRLGVLLMREMMLSALRVARLVTRRHMVMKPGLFAFPLTVDRDFEITLLANLITLTPGTLSVDVSPDRRILYVHAIDCANPDTARADIADNFERAILEAFR